eukprot:TRINITY_DN6325_c0_g1_i3.p1 TRINITY_DN6325_c0_g1~~TRINITY_DN6325_c0_g1_i3.p1  ORF type:complete len:469 (-),score=58.13 TRINITY_DN6325_c0_g1_i3:66-1472(-)
MRGLFLQCSIVSMSLAAAIDQGSSGSVSLPFFTIDLDTDPGHRYDHVMSHFNATIQKLWNDYFANDTALRDAVLALPKLRGPEKDEELQKEIEGMARAVHVPAEFAHAMQYMYELQTVMLPVVNFSHAEDLIHRAEAKLAKSALQMLDHFKDKYYNSNSYMNIPDDYAQLRPLLRLPWRSSSWCTGILAYDKSDNNTVWHARNQDFSPISIFKNLMYNSEYVKTVGGKKVRLFSAQGLAGYTGVLTAMAYDPVTQKGRWAIEMNTRYTDKYGGNKEMLDNLFKEKRTLNGWVWRKALVNDNEDKSISTDSFAEALDYVKSAKVVATEFVVMSGPNKEGAIVAKSPDGYDNLQTLGKTVSSTGQTDYTMITNFDWFFHDIRENFDPTGHGGFFVRPTRRGEAERLLTRALKQGHALTPELLYSTINAKYVVADTVFQAMINVEKGIWNVSQPVLQTRIREGSLEESVYV